LISQSRGLGDVYKRQIVAIGKIVCKSSVKAEC
jgi:hypothetical protein